MNSFNSTLRSGLVVLSMAIAGCVAEESGPAVDPGAGEVAAPPSAEKVSCDIPFERTLSPLRIDGQKHLYFDVDEFEFLFDPKLVIDSIELELSLRGDHRKNGGSLSLDLNGILATSSGGAPFFSLKSYSGALDSSSCGFKLHKMRLNGAEPIARMMMRLFTNRGESRITLHGPNVKILSASIQVKGKTPRPCSPEPEPSPTPTPLPTETPVAPRTTISSVSPPGELVNSSSIAFEFTSDQVGVNFGCSLDGAEPQPCTSPLSYSGLANGRHEFRVLGTGASGLSDGVGASHSWIVDIAPPSVRFVGVEELPAVSGSSVISLPFEGLDSSAVSFSCSLDGAAAVPCVSPIRYAGLLDGAHEVMVSAVDGAGNTGLAPAVFRWTVDLTAPDTYFTLVEPAASITNVTTETIQFAASETANFECSLDGAAFAPCVSPVSHAGLAEGGHRFEVRATDVAGNLGSLAVLTWTVDLTAPVVSLGQVVPAQGITNSQLASIEFFADEPGELSCAVDGGLFEACRSVFTLPLLTEGNHEVRIMAKDLAGNVSTPMSVAWISDFTLPQLSWGAIRPSAAGVIAAASLEAEVIASEPVALFCSVDGVEQGSVVSPIQAGSLAEGEHAISVTGLDQAGNASEALVHRFAVDLTAPVVNLSAELSAATNKTVNTFTFDSSEEAVFECNLDLAGFSACMSPLTVSGLAEGVHRFEVRAIDRAGNRGAVVFVDWSVDLTAPVVRLTASQLGRTSFSVVMEADEAVAGFECALDGAAFGPCQSPAVFENLAVGTHTVAVRAADLLGNRNDDGTAILLAALPAIQTSLLAIEPAGTPTNRTEISFSFTASRSGATFLCRLDGAELAPCASPASYTGLSGGAHSFHVFARDQFDETDPVGAQHLWTIDVTAPVTSLNSSRNENTSISFSFAASEAVQRFECARDGGVYEPCVSPQVLTGVAVGNHSFSVRAVDLAGNVDPNGASQNWTVDPPVVVSISAVSPASNPVASGSMTVYLSANVATATFLCSWDGGAFAPCSSPATISGLGGGTHSFGARGVDRFGLVSATGPSYSWTVDFTPPVVVSFTPVGGSYSVTVNWTTNEPATSKINWGLGNDTSRVVAEDGVFKTSHSVRISGLSSGTLYSFIVSGRDQAGNVYSSIKKQARTY